MRILLSNDDGIHAPGLKVLEKIAHALSDDVWVVVPETDQSGAGHSLTLRHPLRMREVSERKIAITGTPTDCVMIAVSQLIPGKRPDLVLSGVNYGCNLAEDITYSGTVAAAMEGCLLGIPSMALSLTVDYGHPAKWATAESHAPAIIKKLLKSSFGENILMNINFPNVIASSVREIRVVRQGQRRNEGELEERVDPRGHRYFWVGTINYEGRGDEGTDLEAVEDGCIAITPLCLDLTHQSTMNQLKKVFV